MADKNTFIEYAQKYLQKGQLDRAIKEYYRALELDPRDVRTRHKIGELLARQGTRGEALKELGMVAEAHAKEGFYLKSVAVYKQMIKLKDDLYDVHLKLGGLYQQLSLLSEAMDHYRIVAEYYETNGTSKDCLEVYKKIVELSPDDIHNKLKLAEYYVREERNDDAISLYQSVAGELKEKNRFDDLIRVYERLIQLDPSNLELQKALSKLYLEAQDPKRALAKLQVCFKADPGDTETLGLLGETFMSLDQVAKAKSVYKELARIFAYQGFPEKHRETYERIRRIDPSDAEALQVLTGRGPEVAAPADKPATTGQSGSAARVAPGGRPARGGEVSPVATPPTAGKSGLTPPAAQAVPVGVGSSDRLREVPAGVAKLMTETEVYLKYSLVDKATSHLNTILEREPDCYLARERLRELLASQGRTQEAAAESLRMSQLAGAAGDSVQARVDLERAVQLDPNNSQYVHALASLKQLISRQTSASTSVPPFFQASSAAQVFIEEEEEELVDDRELQSFPPGSNLLEEHELVDDSEAAPSVYLTLSSLDLAVEPIEAAGEDIGVKGAGTTSSRSLGAGPAGEKPPGDSTRRREQDRGAVLPTALEGSRGPQPGKEESVKKPEPVKTAEVDTADVSKASPMPVEPRSVKGADPVTSGQPQRGDAGGASVAAAPEVRKVAGGPTSFSGGVPVFEVEDMVEDGEGLDLIRELEIELGFEAAPAKAKPEVERAGRTLELATAYYEMQLFEEAIRELQMQASDGPLGFESQWLLARCRFGQGEIAEAIRSYKTILNRTDLTEEQELEVLFDLGRAYEAQGELQLALDLYEEISSINDQFRDEEVQARIVAVSSRLSPGEAGRAQTAR